MTAATSISSAAGATYTLTVEASDGNGGTDTATDVAEDSPPVPTGLTVSVGNQQKRDSF